VNVNALEAGMTGRYLVTSRGSQHVWDLDKMTYTRLPGETSQLFPYDGQAMEINKVEVWPAVGLVSRVIYDDPDVPEAIEHFRQSSLIRSIESMDKGS
jgi:hypothetical protein